MSVVRDMRAQMRQPQKSGGDGMFYGLLAGILLLGGGGAAWMTLGGGTAAPPAPVAVKSSPETTAVIPATPAPPPVATTGRMGVRERSKAAAACMDDGKMSMASMMSMSAGMSGRETPAKLTPEQAVHFVKAGFQMIDTLFDMERKTAVLGAVMGRPQPRSSGPDNGASMVGDFVECMLSRPAQVICEPDNRAAAVSYVGTYLVRGAEMVAAIDKMEPMKRFKAEQSYNVPQYRVVLRALEQHLRSGSLIAADFGRSPPARLGEMIAANPRQQDACAARS